MSGQTHQSDPRILARRTLERDHRVLARLVQPGMAVLDVGCGVGSITAGIARRVGEEGRVLGLDRNPGLIEMARTMHGGVANLTFEHADIKTIQFDGAFDIVTAARTLQWIAGPEQAVAAMKRAARAGGLVVILDYDHARNTWEPRPPGSFRRAYAAFLEWRKSHGWDNEMGSHLKAILEAAGLADVAAEPQEEVAIRGGEGFGQSSKLWAEVLENVGAEITSDGFLTPAELQQAQADYAAWCGSRLERQTLSLRAAVGRNT